MWIDKALPYGADILLSAYAVYLFFYYFDIFFGVIKLFEGLPKFMRVSREGLTLLECQFLRVWFEGLS